ncbi:MAG: hypothetical protein J5977_02445 [Fibrobacter sp.]|nr:hypothetical protein [Fibrobacter sp.]
MKKISLLLFPALTVAAFFVACGDDDSSSRKVITEVNSIYELGICGEENQGDTVYAKKEDAQYYCDETNWIPVAREESSSSSISSSSNASSSSMTKEELDKFTKLCDASGGTTKDGACVCKNELCDVGAVCNTITGVCGNQSKPTDITDSSDSKASFSSTATTFADLCKASGGTAKDGACVCKETACDEGVLCNTKSKECANKDAVEIECDDSYKNTCSNSLLGVGIVKECVKGIVVNRSCGTVSCNEEGTDCGECLDDVQTCTEDKNFKATVTRCEKGKKVTESCGENSCDPRDNGCGECTNYEHTCTNDEAGKGTVYECVAGEAKKTVSICGNKSCRTDKAICGECLNGELRCDNDINNNAVMYRCVDGQWERLHNKFDPLDKDYYKCPVACREGTDPQKMENECDINQCSDCDPCWGEPMVGAPSNPNPCYNEERCRQILKDEDPAYPPFRDFETKNKWKALIPEEKMAVKTVTGYNWKDYTHTDVNDRVGPFEFDLTNETRRVSCNALGTYFGKCHNTLQTCINKAYHTGGFMVVCSNGDLVDAVDGEEPNGDGIACNCEITTNNAEGCCYTRRTCFKQTNWATTNCRKPSGNENDD